MNALILYASFQRGKVLPGYVRYALLNLSSLGKVVLLTNSRPFEKSEEEMLEGEGIEIFWTENRGFDFGMWRRYFAENENEVRSYSRVILLNDSIVYFRNGFRAFFERAEALEAEVVGLTQSEEISPHFQTFFLYLKGNAIEAVRKFLLKTPNGKTFYEVVKTQEIALSKEFLAEEIKGASLFPTENFPLFSSREFILQGAGFIKRKLLQRRFTLKEQLYFWRLGKAKVLYENYHKLILKSGRMSPDFLPEWLPPPIDNPFKRAFDFFRCALLMSVFKIFYPFVKKRILWLRHFYKKVF